MTAPGPTHHDVAMLISSSLRRSERQQMSALLPLAKC